MNRSDPEHLDHATGCESCSVRAAIREILSSARPPAEKLRAVQLALAPSRPVPVPVVNDRGWPVLISRTWSDDPAYRG